MSLRFNIADHTFHSHQEFHEIHSKIEILKNENIKLEKEDFFKIFQEAKVNHKPLVNTVIHPILEAIKENKK